MESAERLELEDRRVINTGSLNESTENASFADKMSNKRRKALSSREIDVLECMKEGFKNPEIAGKLNLSTKTIENHVRNILLKLGAKNRTQAVVEGLRNSIIVF